MSTAYDHFSARRISAVGAEISGIDVGKPLAPGALEELQHALAANEVLFFKEQSFDAEGQLKLARGFGEISLYPIEALFGAAEPGLQVIVDDADNPPEVDLWHTDVSWLPRPPSAAFLSCLEPPAYGGDTMWSSTSLAYEALSSSMQGLLSGLECIHSCHGDFVEIATRKSGIPELGDRIRKAYPEQSHPLVRTHPESGRRSLFVTDRGVMRCIAGLPKSESDALLDFLDAHVAEPRFQVRWRWGLSQLAIWDERTTLHRGVSDHYPLRRVIRRCTIDGEVPFFDPDRIEDPSYARAEAL